MEMRADWQAIKRLFRSSFSSSFHYAIATVTENGEPHITPIGSLVLGEPCRGFYFEEFPRRLPLNLANKNQVCVLAVNSSRWFWLTALVRGRFTSIPAIRLHGRAGDLRDATDEERTLWQKRVKRLRLTKGYDLMWRNMRSVREIEFTRVEPVNLGAMTRDTIISRRKIGHAR